MLRRTKELVAADLPPKQEQVLEVELTPAHRGLYERQLARERQRVLGLLDNYNANRIAILSALMTMRRLSLDPLLVADTVGYHGTTVHSAKLEVLAQHLTELVAQGHKALVFSQFTDFLKLARARLDKEKIGYTYLDGRTRNRAERIAEFTEGDASVFLISLKAGGVGLTLTEADYVFVLDPWWNPAVEAQAVDRAHRLGQTRPVNVYRLVAKDTIEEKVVALQQRKRELFASVMDEGQLLSSSLTPDDIRSLLAVESTSPSTIGPMADKGKTSAAASDEVKEKFRQALERKKAKAGSGPDAQSGGNSDSGDPHASASHQKEFRRKSG